MEAAVDGGSGNGLFAAAINANDKMVAAASTTAAQLTATTGQENLGDYPSKHHTANIHQHVRPYYVHTDKSPTLLPWALKPSIWQGCAEILGDPYSKKSPLPHIGTIPHL
jgi:hypothetical protein